MKHFSQEVETKLQVVSSITDNIFSDEALKVLKSRRKKAKTNEPNLQRLKGQLPNGIYHRITEVIDVVMDKLKQHKSASITFSPLCVRREAFKPCKMIPYGTGNVITGRDAEIHSVLKTLSKKDKRGVILVGEPGVGKTAIVRAINAKLREGTVPRSIRGCEIHNMDMPYIFTKYKEDPLGVIINILETASADDKQILFIDEVHQLLNQKMNDVLKPYLTGAIRFIGSTTIDEYHAIITDDKALERRFTIVHVDEPSVAKTTSMLLGTKSVFEEHHSCSIPDDTLQYLVVNGSRFLGHRKNPDKSLDILDMSCTIMAEEEVKTTMDDKKESEDWMSEIESDRLQLESIKTEAGSRVLTTDYVNKGISEMTGIDYGMIRDSLNYDYVTDKIKTRVFGQDAAIAEITNVVNIMKHISLDRERPLMVALMIGTSGVGKFSVASELAKYVFGNSGNCIDYDMGAFKDKFMLTELKGAPPGYVGYAKSGRLIKEIRNKPQSVIFFRNINRCNPEIVDYLISSIRKGRMVDSADREVRLNNSIIIFSATLTEEEARLMSRKSMGFSKITSKNDDQSIDKVIYKDLLEAVDSVVHFETLSQDTLHQIYDENVETYLKMYRDVDIDLEELKSKVLENAKTGHDIVAKLSSQIPKMIFNDLRS